MSDYGRTTENEVRISVLSHPDETTSHLIEKLLEKYPTQSTHMNISILSANISTFEWDMPTGLVKVLLIQPVGQLFTDKLHTRYYKSSGAAILFSRNDEDSFLAAKVFYQNFRKGEERPSKPVAFVELFNESDEDLIIDEHEFLDDKPVEYYSIKPDDVTNFQKILETIVKQCRKG